MNAAAAVGIAVYLALITSLAARIARAKARARLPEQMHLRRDSQPAPVDDTCLQLEALYHAPAAERGNQ